MNAIRVLSQPYKTIKGIRENPFRFYDFILSPILLLYSVALLAVFLNPSKEIFAMILLGTIGWRALHATQADLLTGYLDEHWAETKMMLFSSPITTTEFVAGSLLTGLIKFVFVFILMYAAIALSFGVLVPISLTVLYSLLLLLAYGLALGLLSVALAYLYGQSAFPFAFQFSTFFSLGSGAYYSITIFPQWLQDFLMLIPSTHAFNGLKSVFGIAQVNFLHATIITLLWIIVCWKIHGYAYQKARQQGKLASMGS
ncbi:ABC transporter permease [Candidatus Micrarchaeota archaeon]|nr:ABC transporter permease [Candidatus Micrarchaeota archaeon]